MSASIVSTEQYSGPKAKTQLCLGSMKFDMFMIIMTSWFIGGLYLDGWAHSHIPQLETFFTPWHGVLYSGYFACAVTLVGVTVLDHSRGYAWKQAIPIGYGLSLLGAPLFLIGGIADMIWHILFGIEVDTEALLSPTHLLLAFSGALIVSGPFRAAWHRFDIKKSSSWATLFPMILSLIATYSLFTFFTEYASLFVHTRLVTQSSSNSEVSLGITSILLQSGLLMGFVLLLMKRWRLPFGALTFILTVNTAMMGVFTDQYQLVLAAFIAGLAADLFIKFFNPSPERQNALRLFAFLIPFILYLSYFIELMAISGIAWTIHLWLGSCFLAGIVGLVLSYLLVPPQTPIEIEPKEASDSV